MRRLPPSSSRKPGSRHRARGFILVSVLLIVALATILVVVASMMAQVERRAAANTAGLEQARANALFALGVAVNQLQTAAGPDQRVTARAEILDGTNAPQLSTNNAVKQPLWTGVWKTGTNSLDVGASPQRETSLGSTAPTTVQKVATAAWLVSGTNPDPTGFVGVASGTNANAALLASNLGTNAVAVSAPLVTVKSGTVVTGAYAYWVGDEGVKARANSRDPTLGADAQSAQAISRSHFLGPQSPAAHKTFPAASSLSGDFRGNTNLARVTSLADLRFVAATPPVGFVAGSSAPDLTTVSLGVLADVRNGGLKSDLTATFENVAEYGKYFNLDAATSSVYRTVDANPSTPGVGSTGGVVMDGLRWDALNYYYNLYKATPVSLSKAATASPIVTPAGVGTSTLAGAPFSIGARGYRFADYSGGTVQMMDPYSAVPLLIRVEMAISSFKDSSTGNWRLRVHYYPQMVLWNPYSVRLIMSPSGKYNQESNAMGTAYFDTLKVGAVDLLSVAGGFPSVGSPSHPYLIQAANQRIQLYSKAGQLVTMEPGEIRVFGLSDYVGPTSLASASLFDNLVGDSDQISPDFYQSSDLGWAGTPGGSDLVDLSVKANSVGNTLVPNAGYFKATTLGWPSPVSSSSVNLLGPISGPRSSPTGTWTPRTIASLNSNPIRVVGSFLKAKGIVTSAPSTYVNFDNKLPMFLGNNPTFNTTDQSSSLVTAETYTQSYNTYTSSTEINMQFLDGAMRTSWGPEVVGGNATPNRVIMRDIPTQPLISLGQFMHLSSRLFNTSGSWGWVYGAAMFVGGSHACISVNGLQNTYYLSAPGGTVPPQLDHSFLANEKLFDSYFLSTVPAAGRDFAKYPLPPDVNGTSATQFTAQEIAADQPLPNTRMRYYRRDGGDPKIADLRDFKKAAANLMLEGAFNVNSTSVAAWTGLLSSLSGNALKIWNANAGSAATLSQAALKNPIPRFLSASLGGQVNKPWEGMRALSDSEINDLASAIVRQVKLRGPFLSMGDFLNRRLGQTPSDLTLKGALQSAIDDTTLNNAMASGQTVAFGNQSVLEFYGPIFPQNLPANMDTATGIPGWLMQQDLVQAFSPAMTVRSDTFLVRTYGETRNARTGAAEARAWGEAVVQRVPDFVDPSQTPETTTANLNPANKSLGRRFRVVSFRWLNDNEI